MKIVLIGGPVDGERYDIVELVSYIRVANFNQVSIPSFLLNDKFISSEPMEIHCYNRMSFQNGLIVYVSEDLTHDDVMLKLIQGYKTR